MRAITFSEIEGPLAAVRVASGPEVFLGVSTDTRTIRHGQLFVALKGERFDGAAYAREAVAKGAAGLVVGSAVEGIQPGAATVLLVADPLRALGDLAAYARGLIHGRVVGVTGSNGKTTTKDLLAHLLSGRFSVFRTPGNENNPVGLPRAVLSIGDEAWAVLEMGISRFGEMSRLSRIARPDIAVITNIGDAHLEFLRDRAGVARAKGEILEGLEHGAVLVVPADDPHARSISDRFDGRVVTFGECPGADLRAERIESAPDGVRISIAGGPEVKSPLPGKALARLVLAAMAAGREAGLSLSEMAERAATFRMPPMRMGLEQIGRVSVLADCYNANPSSMEAFLQEIPRLADGRRLVAVVGDMLELGPEGESFHRRLGATASAARPALLVGIGEAIRALLEAAGEAGLEAHRILRYPTAEEAAEGLCGVVQAGDFVALKGSRRMRLERVVEGLRARMGNGHA